MCSNFYTCPTNLRKKIFVVQVPIDWLPCQFSGHTDYLIGANSKLDRFKQVIVKDTVSASLPNVTGAEN